MRKRTGISGSAAALVLAGCGSVALLGQQNGTSSSGSGGAATSSSASSSSGNAETCGSLDGPDAAAHCSSCVTDGKPCQANGCYNGYWCYTHSDSASCEVPPDASTCGTSSSASSSGAGGAP